MKKVVKIIIIIIMGLLIIKLGIKIFGKGHKLEYKLKEERISFKISEQLIRNTKDESNSYNISVKTPKSIFYYQIANSFKDSKKIIKEIKYYKDNNYECLLPIFKDDKVLTDVICKISNKYYNYTAISGDNKKLDKFINNISQYNYDNFKDKLDQKEKEKNTIIYKNIEKLDDKIILDNYKGIYILDNQNIDNIELFEKDIYKKHINELNDKYYLIADYNNKYEFHKFYIIDIISGDKSTITSNEAISLDSYIQGSYGENIYLFDKSNKVQYEINVKNKTVKKVENVAKEIKIYNINKWTKTDIYEATEEQIKFNYYEQKNNDNYFKIDKVGQNETGYYYYYSKTSNKYDVFRSNVKSKKQKTYLFTTDDISRIVYKEDKIYYISDNYLKVYSDKTGIKTILKCDELRFNDNLKFYIY